MVIIYIIFYLLLVLFIAYFCIIISIQTFIFRPIKNYPGLPPGGFREVWIQNRLDAWLCDEFEDRPYVLFCHGNSGNLETYEDALNYFYQQNLNILAFDYSGFGISLGAPSIRQVLKDGLDAYDYLISIGVSSEKILIVGYSIGGPIATYVSKNRGPELGLYIINTFTSLEVLLPEPLSFLSGYFVDLLPTIEWIVDIECKLAVSASPDDGFIPWTQGKELAEVGGGIFVAISGTHIDPMISIDAMHEIMTYFGIPII